MDYNIHDIENLSEEEAKNLAEETQQIKGFNIYFIDFKGYFGYSYLVYKNNHYIRYANDYQLHHPSKKTKEELREVYIDSINSKLYTEEEISGPIKDYDEYDKKKSFLHNYYGMMEDHLSIFGNFSDKEYEKWYKEEKKKYPYYNNVAFAYYKDKEFVNHHNELMKSLNKRLDEKKEDFEYQVEAFITEMYNHEYSINWQADYDTLSAFGNIHWAGDNATLDDYFDQLQFSETQRNAYIEARRRYYKKIA